MPGITYGDAGTNRTITGITYGDAGVNRTLIEVWYGDAGTNRKVWPSTSVAASLTNHNPYAVIFGAGTVTAQFELRNTGVAAGVVIPAGFGAGSYAPEWMVAGIASNYEARWTTTSGTLTTGTSGVWQNLGATLIWSKNGPAGVGINTTVGTVEIRDATTLVVLATATIQLDVERT